MAPAVPSASPMRPSTLTTGIRPPATRRHTRRSIPLPPLAAVRTRYTIYGLAATDGHGRLTDHTSSVRWAGPPSARLAVRGSGARHGGQAGNVRA
jgi:hypothetical protein